MFEAEYIIFLIELSRILEAETPRILVRRLQK